MAANTDTTASTPNYAVKQVDQIVKGTDVLVRLFTLAPSDVIPWHYHSESTDHYFVLSGTLGISIRDPEAACLWRTLAHRTGQAPPYSKRRPGGLPLSAHPGRGQT
jgi:hypothetical protein